MVSIVVLDENDEEFHQSNPDKNDVTFCGIDFDRDEVARFASFGARYVDDVLAQVATEEDKDACEECRANTDEETEE